MNIWLAATGLYALYLTSVFCNNDEAVRCYDCNYDPEASEKEGADTKTWYGGSQRERGFPECALDSEADSQLVDDWLCRSGACFIRKDTNGLVYRGCADSSNLPLGVDVKVNCQYQGQIPSLWWFCEGNQCNGGKFGSADICAEIADQSSFSDKDHDESVYGPARDVQDNTNGYGKHKSDGSGDKQGDSSGRGKSASSWAGSSWQGEKATPDRSSDYPPSYAYATDPNGYNKDQGNAAQNEDRGFGNGESWYQGADPFEETSYSSYDTRPSQNGAVSLDSGPNGKSVNSGSKGFDFNGQDNGGSWNGNNAKSQDNGGSWNGNNGKSQDNGGSWNGNNGNSQDNGGSWNGNNGKSQDNGGSWNGNNGKSQDNGGSWNGKSGKSQDNGGSWNGNNGKSQNNGESWNGNNGKSQDNGGSWNGNNGKSQDNGGSWNGNNGKSQNNGESWNGNNGKSQDNGGSWNGNNGKSKDNGGSWNGNNGKSQDIGGSFNGNNGKSQDNGGSWNGNNGKSKDSGGSWNGNNGKSQDNGGSWNGNNVKSQDNGGSWNGNNGKSQDNGESWNGNNEKSQDNGGSWNGKNGKSKDTGGSWNGNNGKSLDVGGSWNGNNGKSQDNGGSWNGKSGKSQDIGGSWNGNNGKSQDNGGSWNGKSGTSQDNGGSWNGNNGKSQDNGGSWNGNNGKSQDNGGSWNGNNGKPQDNGGSWKGNNGKSQDYSNGKYAYNPRTLNNGASLNGYQGNWPINDGNQIENGWKSQQEDNKGNEGTSKSGYNGKSQGSGVNADYSLKAHGNGNYETGVNDPRKNSNNGNHENGGWEWNGDSSDDYTNGNVNGGHTSGGSLNGKNGYVRGFNDQNKWTSDGTGGTVADRTDNTEWTHDRPNDKSSGYSGPVLGNASPGIAPGYGGDSNGLLPPPPPPTAVSDKWYGEENWKSWKPRAPPKSPIGKTFQKSWQGMKYSVKEDEENVLPDNDQTGMGSFRDEVNAWSKGPGDADAYKVDTLGADGNSWDGNQVEEEWDNTKNVWNTVDGNSGESVVWGGGKSNQGWDTPEASSNDYNAGTAAGMASVNDKHSWGAGNEAKSKTYETAWDKRDLSHDASQDGSPDWSKEETEDHDGWWPWPELADESGIDQNGAWVADRAGKPENKQDKSAHSTSWNAQAGSGKSGSVNHWDNALADFDHDGNALDDVSEFVANPCDGTCKDNPAGLFSHPLKHDWFVQCTGGADQGTPCRCCRPHYMRCPRGTSFDVHTRVCSLIVDTTNQNPSYIPVY